MSQEKQNKPLSTSLVVPFLVLSIWIWITDFMDYFLTEKYYLFNNIDEKVNAVLIPIIVLVITYFENRVFIRNQTIKNFLIVFFFIITISFHVWYEQYLSYLTTVPKIKGVSQDWSIQGEKVVIYGKNFGDEWRGGKVVVGDLEFVTKSWTNTKIIVEQPVPRSFYTGKLEVITAQGRSAMYESFEIRDPKSL